MALLSEGEGLRHPAQYSIASGLNFFRRNGPVSCQRIHRIGVSPEDDLGRAMTIKKANPPSPADKHCVCRREDQPLQAW
jgi:hypothetical protein